MKTTSCIRQKSLGALVAALSALITAINFAGAQPLQPELLVSFNGTNGAHPEARLTAGSDGNFYGTTSEGGDYGYGTVFRVTTNGVLTTLYSFTAITNSPNVFRPYPSALTLGADGIFYGVTALGDYLDGAVFRVTTNGVLTTLVSFEGTNGAGPLGLTLGNDGDFYGMTSGGGDFGYGSAFRVTTNGLLTMLVSFAGANGAFPAASLTQASDGNFYGTTQSGGIGWDPFNFYGDGTVFRVTTNGVLTTLASFDLFGNDAVATSGLTLGSDGNFYGTAFNGSIGETELAFQVTTNGVLTEIASLGVGISFSGDLTLGRDGNLYGATEEGMMFQLTTNGVLTTLASFAGPNGADPQAGLTLDNDGNFYGTTYRGGTDALGVIYRLRHGVSVQSFGMKTNGFQLNTLNVSGSGWVVLESSSDLANWTPIQTNGSAAAQQFLDPAALTQPRQFYRVRQQ